MFSKQFLKDLEGSLLQEKAKLEEELARFAKKDVKPIGDYDTVFPKFEEHASDQGVIADEVEEYDRLISIEHALEKRLQEVNLALERINQGKFGKCQNCKKEIPKERLKANPAATTCLKCKKV
jgi:DnaK suppressor protein